MIVLPADHWVRDRAAFRRTLRRAVGLALQNDQLINDRHSPRLSGNWLRLHYERQICFRKTFNCFSGKTIYGKTDTRFGTTAGAPARSVEQRHFRLEGFHRCSSSSPAISRSLPKD